MYDYLTAGFSLYRSIFARQAFDAGKNVFVIVKNMTIYYNMDKMIEVALNRASEELK